MIKDKLLKYLRKNPYIYFDEFIQLVHSDQNHGYYVSEEMIGSKGDFITAPEISQMFGEVIAIKILQVISKNNIKHFNLIELGPGRGTLIIDILRVLNKRLSSKINISLHFNEINKNFIKNLKLQFPKCKFHSVIGDYPDRYSFFIANEFVDALPFRQIKKRDNIYYETVIKRSLDGNLEFDIEVARTESEIYVKSRIDLKNNQIFEYSPKTIEAFNQIINFLEKNKGYLLLIDYGYVNHPLKSTIQSIKNHKMTDVLNNIGKQDITYHVNFDCLISILKNKKFLEYRFQTQADFLKFNGIEERANRLCKQNPGKAEEIKTQLNRLIDNEHMGKLFKVLEVEI